LAAVVLPASSPLPPFSASSPAANKAIRRHQGRIRADRGANQVDLAADLGNRLANRGKGKGSDKIRGSPPYLSTRHECGRHLGFESEGGEGGRRGGETEGPRESQTCRVCRRRHWEHRRGGELGFQDFIESW
jgi:hypothetical protein